MASGNLVSGDISNFIGGVSQQPWNVRMPTQAEEQINCHATVTEFLRRRPALRQVANISVPGGSSNFITVGIDKGEGERYVALFSKEGIKVYDIHGVEQTVDLSDSGRKYLGQCVEASVDLRFCDIKDYTFCVNRRVFVGEEKEAASTRTSEAIIFIKQASYQTTYKVTLDGTTYQHTTGSGIYEEGTDPPDLSANSILSEIASAIPSTYNVQVNGPTMWVRRSDDAYFTYGTSDNRSNTHIVSFRDSIQKMTDLPLIAPNGMVLRVTGDQTTNLDDYYITFVTTDESTYGSGSWNETVAPASISKLDSATMPHALVRRTHNTFSFEPVEWKAREAGDETTNPAPSFVDKQINNILFYRNRLAFLSGDNIVMSEANSFFNFYLTTVTTAVDSDPIDVAANGIKEAILYGSAVYTGGLIIFSTKGQFALEHDTVLSNATVSLTPITEYESSDRVVPQASGKTIFFAMDRGKWIGIREYVSVDSDSVTSNDATDVSSHVPHYMLGKIRDLQCSSNEEVLLISSTSALDTIYVYKYFWNGNEKAQSAWYQWKMSGNIYGHVFFGTDVYCVMEYKGSYTLEVMSLEPAFKDTGEDIEFCLDRKVDETSCTVGAYDALTRTTPITLPYADDRALIITRTGGDVAAGYTPDIIERNGNIVTIKGRFTQGRTLFFVGVPFESTYEFTTFGIRNQNQTAITSGRLQLRYLNLNLHDTGYVELKVSPKGKMKSIYSFIGKRLGDLSATIGDIPIYNGQIKIPILSRNEDVSISIHSDSPLPYSFVNGWWEGFYTTRNQRM